MTSRVLVAYASKHGGTAEIAEKIGEVLREAGLSAEVLPADEVDDVRPYQAVLLGSGVYIGRWRKPAATFLKANEEALAQKPVWLFSSGPTGEGDPEKLVDGWQLPERLRPVAERIDPRDIMVFHGVLDEGEINIVERWVVKNVKAPLGDFRNWDAISSWARSIADALQEGQSTSASS